MKNQINIVHKLTAVVAQSVRALASQAKSWVFESPSRQTLVVKTGSDSSTVKRSTIGVSVTGPRRWPYKRMFRVTVDVAR